MRADARGRTDCASRCFAAWLVAAIRPFTHAVPSQLTPTSVSFRLAVRCSTASTVHVDARALTARQPWANETMAVHARRLARSSFRGPRSNRPHSESVSRSIILLLPSGHATLAQVAANLATSERTLQRELEKEGVGFAALAESKLGANWRCGTLVYPEQSITSIAELLGYALLFVHAGGGGRFGLSPALGGTANDHASTDGALKATTIHPIGTEAGNSPIQRKASRLNRSK